MTTTATAAKPVNSCRICNRRPSARISSKCQRGSVEVGLSLARNAAN